VLTEKFVDSCVPVGGLSVTKLEAGGVGGHTVCTVVVAKPLTLEVVVKAVNLKRYAVHVDKNPAGMYRDWFVYPMLVMLTFPPVTDQA